MSHHVVNTLVIRFVLHQPLGMKPLTIFLFTFPSHEELANIQVQCTLAIILPASSFLVSSQSYQMPSHVFGWSYLQFFLNLHSSTASSLVELTDFFLHCVLVYQTLCHIFCTDTALRDFCHSLILLLLCLWGQLFTLKLFLLSKIMTFVCARALIQILITVWAICLYLQHLHLPLQLILMF